MYLDGLCFITDSSICSLSYEDMALKALQAGLKWVQYRDKKRTRREIYEEAVRLRAITKDFNAVFLVNDHADIAAKKHEAGKAQNLRSRVNMN